MKANVHTNSINVKHGKGPFDGHEIRLSIGMIVKNEEKNLEKCLSALKPLLDAVPSELIVTDTGSTDRTVEIAQKYTDHILHFEWCNDFSTARNTGLFTARGQWFMFIDADEWMNDVTELIQFFSDGECDQYWSGSFIIRSYADLAGKQFSDFHACRLFRVYPGIHFKNKVHEDITRALPTKFFSAFAHHYGYAFHNTEEQEEKNKRNMDLLLEELEENPNDLKTYNQLVNQLSGSGQPEKAVEYAKKALAIPCKDTESYCRYIIFRTLLFTYYGQRKYQELLDALDDFLKSDSRREIPHLDCLRVGQIAAAVLKQYEKSVEYGNEYLSLYDQYTSGKISKNALLYGVFRYLEPSSQQDALIGVGWSLVTLGQPEEALKCVDRLDFSVDNSTKNGSLPLCSSLAQMKDDWSILINLYGRILDVHDDGKKYDFISYCEEFLKRNPDRKEAFTDAFAECPNTDTYVFLNRLRLSERKQDRKSALNCIDWFVHNGEPWNFHLSDVLYYAMTEKINIMPLLLRIDIEDLPATVKDMQLSHTDFNELTMDYFTEFSFENVKGLYWSVCMLERAVLTFANIYDFDMVKFLELFKEYARQSARYVRSLYKPEMFSPSSIAALPRACRFGYYMGLAFAAHDQSDGVAYLANLRAALKEYPIMEKPIDLLLKEFETEQKQQAAKADEFRSLAVQVKQTIEELLRQGNLEKAGQVTAQIARLMPNDEDVLRFQKLTHTEPTMREIASRLPQ